MVGGGRSGRLPGNGHALALRMRGAWPRRGARSVLYVVGGPSLRSQPGTPADLMRPLLLEATALAVVREGEQPGESLRANGCQVPTPAVLLEAEAPSGHDEDDEAPMQTRRGCQHVARAAIRKRAPEMLFANVDPASRAQLLSQSGERARCAFNVVPT